ncbi:uncharacterized protein LOC143026118 [Oratosquilla oratoria]|uniref:uncharacterized protein LOC143026118 n=1 Tax=Oratosquilla oratoria TaxID=337810 RepID=UPI003F75B19A
MARRQCWLSALPVVMLGVRLLPGESGISPFTAATGSQLMCPRVLVNTELDSARVQHEFVRDLCARMSELDFHQLTATTDHSSAKLFVPHQLMSCAQVWVRVDRVRKPLEAPYRGPFKVLRRSDKTFTILLPSGANETVSIDRLKPAHLPTPPAAASTLAPVPSANDGLDEPQRTTNVPTSEPEDTPRAPMYTRTRRKVTFKQDPNSSYY